VRPAQQGIARRYAQALLEVAAAQADPARLREELRAVARLLRDNRELALAFSHPALGPERRRRLARAVLEGSGASELLLRRVDLLAERGRLGLLEAIRDAYEAAFNARRGVAAAEVRTAQPLQPAQLEALTTALRRATGGEVELTTALDPRLLGGVQVQVGGRIYDGTVRRQLERLRERLVLGAERG